MLIGFTGTRYGMTVLQTEILRSRIKLLAHDDVYFVHGGCVGADFEFHNLVVEYGPVLLYPGYSSRNPDDNQFEVPITDYDMAPSFINEPLPFLERNRIMVERADVMFAAPPGPEGRGGTWYTINYARKNQKPVTVVMPDGELRFINH